jgi:ParB family chromosome partitioning protein
MATKRPSAIELMLQKKTEGVKEKIENRVAPSIADQKPVTMPGQLGAFRLEAKAYVQQINDLQARLDQALEEGAKREIRLDQLTEIPGRRRKLTAAEYAELVANLEHNPLVTPITVRKREDGKFEIISGHNRAAAFRDLKRQTIPAVIADTDQAQADINAFYANLLQTDLSDYEKYLGFRMLQERFPDLKQADIARQSGKSEALISALMSYQELPQEAIAILDSDPYLLGSTAAHRMAQLAQKGRAEQVVAAIARIKDEGIDQNEAIKIASVDPIARSAAEKPKAVTVKQGRATYCQVQRASKVLRVSFKSEEEAEAAQEAVLQALENLAKARAEKSSDSEAL